MIKQILIFSAFFILFNFSNQFTSSQTFTKITSGAFVNDGGASRSVNFIDYDNDGDLDLYVSNGKRFGQRSFLYQNNAGIFNRIFNTGPVNDSLPFDGSSWGDFDNDGNIDFCTVTWYDSISVLYRNTGSGNFSFMTGSPVVTNRGFSETCSWGDYDNDGLLDLIIVNSKPSNSRNRLYHNEGSGNFVSVDSGAVFGSIGLLSRCINWVDIDNDGDQDIYIANESGSADYMYKNNGSGYFTSVTGIPPTTSGGVSWSSSWGDYDNDGDQDLFVANSENQNNFLFRNDGNFSFTKILNDPIVNETGYFASSGWGDYDNDGDLDMFVTQAYGPANVQLVNHLYKNKLVETGTPSFERISETDINNDLGYSYGFAWADWDSDGDLDIYTARTFNENQNNSAFLNNGNSGKWIEIKLTGNATNRSAIGSKVKVKAVLNGNPVWLTRIVEGQSGYCGQNLDLHFGLGNTTVIDSIKVEWQTGQPEYFTNIQVNNVVRIVQGTGIIGIQNEGNAVPEGFKLYQNYPNPFNPSTSISFSVPNSMNNMHFDLNIYDLLGCKVRNLLSSKLNTGEHTINWNAESVPSGTYFYTLSSGKFQLSSKMVLIK